jgi:hypothetical protein
MRSLVSSFVCRFDAVHGEFGTFFTDAAGRIAAVSTEVYR